ncbi:hypothetical protein SFUMM280S_00367 [Streptomyces fumanus]
MTGEPTGGERGTGEPGTGVAAPAASTGRQVRTLSFDGVSGVVPLARDFTRQALYAWGWLPAASADQRAAEHDDAARDAHGLAGTPHAGRRTSRPAS